MTFKKSQSRRISELISQLEKDRSWVLKEIDQGHWPEYRVDLAALERELGQLLIRASELIDE